jgi:hypothetical protein
MRLIMQLECTHIIEIETSLNPFLGVWQCDEHGQVPVVSAIRSSGTAVRHEEFNNLINRAPDYSEPAITAHVEDTRDATKA